MKNILILILISVLGLTIWINIFKEDASSIPVNNQYEIDSLQMEINLLSSYNDLLYDSVHILNCEKEKYFNQISNLNKQLKNERLKTQEMVDRVDSWTDDNILWFLSNRYKGFNTDSIIKTYD